MKINSITLEKQFLHPHAHLYFLLSNDQYDTEKVDIILAL